MQKKALIMDEKAVSRALMRITHEIIERNRGVENLCLVGIKRRGVPLAEQIAGYIARYEGVDVPCGELDIHFYRDDLSESVDTPVIQKAELSFDVTDRKIVLVDDVLYTSRTTRAAIGALFALGRPQAIQLAVLIDRGHRELPIRADYVGKSIPTARSESVEVLIPPFDNETAVWLCQE